MLPGRKTRPDRLRCRHAFTMVEIAIVVAVIAVISALILPALARVKQQSHASRCVNNSRHVGAAFAVYADNNDGEYVPFKESRKVDKYASVAGDEGKAVAYSAPNIGRSTLCLLCRGNALAPRVFGVERTTTT